MAIHPTDERHHFRRMKAMIRGVLGYVPDNEDEFAQAWADVKYYLSIVNQVKYE